ncbi:MAG: aryl-sulfate sulfotransferase [Nonlabens sp.]|uniref:aryl-sulfate sulfotransferase n=1 Tax=Nonlabens sp. TaxID=1888209 RepID=UPI003EF79ACD
MKFKLTYLVLLVLSTLSCKSDDDDMTAAPVLTNAVTIYKTGGFQDGYILATPSFTNKTFLIDKEGFPVKKWESDDNALMAYLDNDGGIYRAIQLNNPDFNFGGQTGGIEKLDKDGNQVWQWEYNSNDFILHHDLVILPNGNLLASVWDKKDSSEAILNGRDLNLLLSNEVWPDRIIEIEPLGSNGANIVWEWSVWDHLVQDYDSTKNNFGSVSAHPELIDINNPATDGLANFNHINSLEYIEEFDQIVMSSRIFSEIWVIDHSTTTAQAATHTGGNAGKGGDLLYRWGNSLAHKNGNAQDQKLFGQHDATYIASTENSGGTFMVFNNNIDDNLSAVVEIAAPIDSNGNYIMMPYESTAPLDYSWIYQDSDIKSPRTSGAYRLLNGNTLITSGTGRILREINSSQEIVWEYSLDAQLGFELSGSPFKTIQYEKDFQGIINAQVSILDPSDY